MIILASDKWECKQWKQNDGSSGKSLSELKSIGSILLFWIGYNQLKISSNIIKEEEEEKDDDDDDKENQPMTNRNSVMQISAIKTIDIINWDHKLALWNVLFN